MNHRNRDDITEKVISAIFGIILVCAVGYAVGYGGYLIGSKKVTEDSSRELKAKQELTIKELTAEVCQLQKDFIVMQETVTLLLIRMTFMEKWKDSILYRPPETAPLFRSQIEHDNDQD